MKKDYDIGTKRIDSKSLKILIKTTNSWKQLEDLSVNINDIVSCYYEKNSVNYLIDEKHPEFFKGSIRPDNKISGERIKILPDGTILSRAGFSLFAKNLRFNNDPKHEWDVCYENTSGLKTYLYSEEKIHLEQEKKFKIVQKFSENYEKIIYTVEKKLNEIKYLALYTILKTYIRVGNYDYYLKNFHKGLTTLQKKDFKIEGDQVLLEFIGKDAVPHLIKKKFPKKYITEIKKILSSKKGNEFVFTGSRGNPLHSEDFSSILFKITDEHFYPHIIRSHHADTKCLEFLEGKSEVKDPEKLFFDIAKDLGHKKFNKKKGVWEVNPKITITNYIYPGYVQKIRSKK